LCYNKDILSNKGELNMKCRQCGNNESFEMVMEIAYWDKVIGKWIEDWDDKKIVCDECGSFDIEDEEWDFGI
jgi:hypothetical protein